MASAIRNESTKLNFVNSVYTPLFLKNALFHDSVPSHSFSNLLGFCSPRRKANLIKNGPKIIVTRDKTTSDAKRLSLKIPYVAAMLAVAKVVDI